MLVTISDFKGGPLSLTHTALCSWGGVQTMRAIMPNAPECVLELSTCLCPEETARAARFLSDESRMEFVFGRSLLRHLLGVQTKIAPERLAFGYGPWGKPFLKSPATATRVQFNLSHSNGQLIIAWSDNRSVGVDIERIHSEMDWLPVARHYLSPVEVDALLSFPTDLQTMAFFKAWTCKEAYLKATGQGLIGTLSDTEVILSPDREPELRTSQSAASNQRKWHLQSLPVGKGFVGALVFEEFPQ